MNVTFGQFSDISPHSFGCPMSLSMDSNWFPQANDDGGCSERRSCIELNESAYVIHRREAEINITLCWEHFLHAAR
ncbi:hypothetical protein CEXT_109511 [Caerostris extrusa]|uniref:Uncharacterized protein n=1 Tax=Caerostris extrusa TaxID=172846 RepID=A0AAV4WT59_CAEEX|nr:hypothetical protein CEXT_109511 [Caerostris extrusa]